MSCGNMEVAVTPMLMVPREWLEEVVKLMNEAIVSSDTRWIDAMFAHALTAEKFLKS